MLRFHSDTGDSVEIEHLPDACADLHVTVRVTRSTFTAAIDTWIQRHDWFRFTQQLTVLEETRQGEATAESMSPGEFRLVVRSVDRAGHLGIEGAVGEREFDRTIQLTFSVFTFDPSQIVDAAREAREISESLG